MKVPKPPEIRGNILELAILMACIVAPMFILANELSGDEFIKASSGLALAGMVGFILSGYKLWKVQKK